MQKSNQRAFQALITAALLFSAAAFAGEGQEDKTGYGDGKAVTGGPPVIHGEALRYGGPAVIHGEARIDEGGLALRDALSRRMAAAKEISKIHEPKKSGIPFLATAAGSMAAGMALGLGAGLFGVNAELPVDDLMLYGGVVGGSLGIPLGAAVEACYRTFKENKTPKFWLQI